MCRCELTVRKRFGFSHEVSACLWISRKLTSDDLVLWVVLMTNVKQAWQDGCKVVSRMRLPRHPAITLSLLVLVTGCDYPGAKWAEIRFHRQANDCEAYLGLLESLAQEDDSRALYALGFMHLTGGEHFEFDQTPCVRQMIEMDSSKGLAYLERSAKLGGNLAKGLLSAVYSQGSGTRPPDGQKALTIHFEQPEPKSFVWPAAQLLIRGDLVERDLPAAKAILDADVMWGDWETLYLHGLVSLMLGEGYEADAISSFTILKRYLNDWDAGFKRGTPEEVIERAEVLLNRWLAAYLDTNPNPRLPTALGYGGSHFPALGSAEALEEELRTSARKGNPKDQWLLANYLAGSLYSEPNSPRLKEARYWAELGAEQGHLGAKALLSRINLYDSRLSADQLNNAVAESIAAIEAGELSSLLPFMVFQRYRLDASQNTESQALLAAATSLLYRSTIAQIDVALGEVSSVASQSATEEGLKRADDFQANFRYFDGARDKIDAWPSTVRVMLGLIAFVLICGVLYFARTMIVLSSNKGLARGRYAAGAITGDALILGSLLAVSALPSSYPGLNFARLLMSIFPVWVALSCVCQIAFASTLVRGSAGSTARHVLSFIGAAALLGMLFVVLQDYRLFVVEGFDRPARSLEVFFASEGGLRLQYNQGFYFFALIWGFCTAVLISTIIWRRLSMMGCNVRSLDDYLKAYGLKFFLVFVPLLVYQMLVSGEGPYWYMLNTDLQPVHYAVLAEILFAVFFAIGLMRAEGNLIGLEPKLLRAVVPAFIAGVGVAIFQVVQASVSILLEESYGVFAGLGASMMVVGFGQRFQERLTQRFRVIFLDGSQGSLGSIEFEEFLKQLSQQKSGGDTEQMIVKFSQRAGGRIYLD